MDDNIKKLKKDLADNYHDTDDEVITSMYEHYLSIASDTSNRKKTDEKLIPYVFNAVKESYLKRGDEGKNSSNEGGLSSSYIDIEEKLRKDVLSIRVGNF